MLIERQQVADLSPDEIADQVARLRREGWEKVTYTVRKVGDWKEYEWYGQQSKR